MDTKRFEYTICNVREQKVHKHILAFFELYDDKLVQIEKAILDLRIDDEENKKKWEESLLDQTSYYKREAFIAAHLVYHSDADLWKVSAEFSGSSCDPFAWIQSHKEAKKLFNLLNRWGFNDPTL